MGKSLAATLASVRWHAPAWLVRENGQALEADVIVPVPLHKIRRRKRGFNQAELLSKRLAKRRKLPHQGILSVRNGPVRISTC
jgi:predicted amidophosphoribosyltransferase